MQWGLRQAGFAVSPISKSQENLTKIEESVHERPVRMPDRWVRALGNAAEIHREMKPVFTQKGVKAQAFIASLFG